MATTKLVTRVAREYVKAVKEEFKDNRETYDTFLKIIKDFANHKIGRNEVISKVKELFKGHQKLILGFNKLMLKCYNYKVTVESDHAQVPTPELGDALGFVDKVKARFHENSHAYNLFLETLYMYRHGLNSVSEVNEVLTVLFRNHHDLLEEFAQFLPRNLNTED